MRPCRRFVDAKSLLTVGVLITVSALLVFGFKAQTAPSNVPKLPANFNLLPGPQAVHNMPVDVLDPNPGSVRLRFYDPPIERKSVTLGGRQFASIRMDGEASTDEPGAPDLPRVARMAMIEKTGNVQLTVSNQSYTTVQLTNDVSPVQILAGDKDAPANGFTETKASVYSQNKWYPENIVEITEPATLRDVRFVVVNVHPVQVNPVTREMRVYDNIEVQVSNAGGVGSNEITVSPTSLSPDWKKLYASFENFRGSSLDELPVIPGQFIAICRNNVDAVLWTRLLVAWKVKRGIDAKMYTTDSTGTGASSIQSFIRGKYTASNGLLESVCLVGDPNGGTGFDIPTDGTQFDNYYGTMTAGSGPNPDPVPDIAIGRLSCGAGNELAATIAKTINYESNPYVANSSWFTRTWCAAHVAAGTEYILSNPSTKQYTRQIMLQHGVAESYWTIYDSHISTTDIATYLGAGISVFNDRMAWINQTNNDDVYNACPSNAMSPFVMCITCGTGNFNGDGTSEEWLCPSQNPLPSTSSPRGAIGCVGMQGSSTHVQYNNIIDAGTMYGLYVLDVQTQGMALVAGKLELYRNYQQTAPGDVQNFCYWANLMGDPSVPIWRYRPVPVAVTHPDSVARGTNSLTFTVTSTETSQPVADAFVCLVKDSVITGRGYTAANGQITLPCATTTVGKLYLTVTKENIKPYVDSIRVTQYTASLGLFSVTLDDGVGSGTVGDNNHVANPGEIIDLNIRLANNGSSGTVSAISGTLTSTCNGIAIIQGTSTYPNIAAAGNAAPNTLYRIRATSVFDSVPATLLLAVTSSAGPATIRVDLLPRAPNVRYESSTFYTSGGVIDPVINPGDDGDFRVTFRNTGARPTSNARGILRSLDPLIIVTDSLGTYGNVNAGSTANNDADRFHIRVIGTAFDGHKAVLQLVVRDTLGFRDSTSFDSTNFFTTDTVVYRPVPYNFYVTIGTRGSADPTGPDARGYYAYDDSEVPTGMAAIYEWKEIAPGHGGVSGTLINFSDTGDNLDSSVVLTLPFSFTMYNHAYSQITVCSNGWLAFGSYAIDDYRNYRMGSPIGAPNMVAPYWDDLKVSGSDENVFYYYNSVEHAFIVEWRARTIHTNVIEYFEVLIYDPAAYPSGSGNGKIKFQYQNVTADANSGGDNDNAYATIGIENADHSTGIDYAYSNTYSPGSATIQNNRAIMFTTDNTGQLIPSMKLSYPDGGELWYTGLTGNIVWNSTALMGGVNIALNRSYPSASWETLYSNTENDGIQTWTIAGAVSSNCRMRVISVSNPTIGDTSYASFTIATPTVTLVSPNGGELMQGGQECPVTWTSLGLGAVKIELNRSYPSSSWEVLSLAATDGFTWIVSGTPTVSARIRITGVTAPTVSDTSNANFIIGAPPVVTHDPHADQSVGTAVFTVKATDDAPTFTTKLFYKLTSSVTFDSLTFSPTGNPTEYAVTTPSLAGGTWEYYLRATDPQNLSTFCPASGTYKFTVGIFGSSWIIYDDSTAENYNWVDGPDYKWAEKFDPGTYPYALCAGKFAICPSSPSVSHGPVLVKVILSDGPGGLPGTVVFSDTCGSPSNVIGGLPAGAAWANIVTRRGDSCLTVNGPFYISVENPEPRLSPVAFGTDTTTTLRNHRSYFYDNCLSQWFNEDAVTPNARPGDRMVRANGFPLTPLQTVIYQSGNDANIRWTSNGAPYYRVYSCATPSGAYTLAGTVSGLPAGQSVLFTDAGVITTRSILFYRVYSSDKP